MAVPGAVLRGGLWGYVLVTSLLQRLGRVVKDVSRRRELSVLAAMIVAVLFFPRQAPAGSHALAVLAGAALALHAIGLMLVYQTDGILNFSQVQIGAVGATFFVLFARYAPLLTLAHNACPSCIERRTPAMYAWNYLAAALLGIGVSIALGWLVSTLVIRRFAQQPRLVATVATVFLVPVLGLLQRGMANVMLTTEQRELSGGTASLGAPTQPVHASFHWGNVVFGLPQMFLIGLLVVAIAIVWVFLRKSASGRALRAVADNPARASTLGMEVSRIRNRAWVIAAGLSGAVMVIGAMTAGAAQPGVLGVETMVRILAVAVIARMASFPVAIVAALTIGVFQNAVDWSFNAASLVDGLLLLIIGAVLLLQRRDATRAERERESAWRFGREVRPTPAEMRSHPAVRSWKRNMAALIAVVVVAFPWIMSPGQITIGTAALLAGLVGLSILVLTGWAGQISLGQMAFAAIGAYVAAVSHIPFPFAIALGAIAGAAVAVVVGIPALRLRGLNLAVTSLALALATSALVLDEHRLGRFLPSSLRRPHLLTDDKIFYEAVLAILALSVAVVVALRRSRLARALIAGRDNEQAAESFGVGLVRARLTAFAVSGFLAALSGALLAYQQSGVQAASFAPEESVRAFLWAVIGGLGAVAGPLLGAAVRGMTDAFSSNAVVQLAAAGAGGLLLLITVPGGLARIVFGIRDGALRRLALRDRIVVPSLLADVRTDAERERVAIAARDGGTPVPRYRLEDQWALAINGDEAKEPVRG
ncbi:MAG: hypothetical protein ABR548_10560 [Actinomycetota bacterium]